MVEDLKPTIHLRADSNKFAFFWSCHSILVLPPAFMRQFLKISKNSFRTGKGTPPTHLTVNICKLLFEAESLTSRDNHKTVREKSKIIRIIYLDTRTVHKLVRPIWQIKF